MRLWMNRKFYDNIINLVCGSKHRMKYHLNSEAQGNPSGTDDTKSRILKNGQGLVKEGRMWDIVLQAEETNNLQQCDSCWGSR